MTGQSRTFGPFRLDPGGVLWRAGQPVPLGRRGALLLAALLSQRGAVVGKAALIDATWPGEAVEESNLSVQIAKLRRSVGDGFIRTVERVGYQLVDEPAAPRRFVAPSVCVRPFRRLGDAGELQVAVTDDLVTALTRFGSLRVMAAQAAPAAADYVLEGSVRRDGGRIEISARLAEGRSGAYCWAERSIADGEPGSVVDRIASTVEGQIELAEIAAMQREHPRGEEGPDLYRRAQLHAQVALPDDHAAAAALLQRAIALEPDNVRYLATLCDGLGSGISMGWPAMGGDDARRLVLELALRGLRQPSVDADALCSFGFGIFRAGDPDWGYSLIQRAAELNPASMTVACLAGNTALHWGTLAEAEDHFQRGLALSPAPLPRGNMMGGMARLAMIAGRFEDALHWARRAHGLSPNYGGIRWTLVAANAHLGREGETAAQLTRFRADHPGVTVASIRAGQPNGGRLASTLEGLDQAGMAAGD